MWDPPLRVPGRQVRSASDAAVASAYELMPFPGKRGADQARGWTSNVVETPESINGVPGRQPQSRSAGRDGPALCVQDLPRTSVAVGPDPGEGAPLPVGGTSAPPTSTWTVSMASTDASMTSPGSREPSRAPDAADPATVPAEVPMLITSGGMSLMIEEPFSIGSGTGIVQFEIGRRDGEKRMTRDVHGLRGTNPQLSGSPLGASVSHLRNR